MLDIRGDILISLAPPVPKKYPYLIKGWIEKIIINMNFR